VSPFEYRIVSDPARKGDALECHGKDAVGLQSTFSMLYINRGRTVWDAAQDAEDFYIAPSDFLRRVERLVKLGLVELNGDSIFLPLRPRSILDRLSAIKK